MTRRIARHRFAVSEYHAMAATRILGEDDRLELIEGEIVDVAPIGGQHIRWVNRLTGLFARGVTDVVVQAQSPIVLDERTEPQPDLALLRPETSGGRKRSFTTSESAQTMLGCAGTSQSRVPPTPISCSAKPAPSWAATVPARLPTEPGIIQVAPGATSSSTPRRGRREEFLVLVSETGNGGEGWEL